MFGLAIVVACIPSLTAGDDGARPEQRVESSRLMTTLRALPTRRAARGDVAHQQGLVETESLVQAWLRDLGYAPTVQALKWNLKYQAEQEKAAGVVASRQAPETTEELAAHTWNNILVDLPGAEVPKEMLIISSHIDAAPDAPGADDNGTGVAALLEVARVLKDRPMRRTVRLIFFNLEELGLKGSVEYVRSGRIAKDEKVIGMVSLEMLGYFTDAPGSQRSPIPKVEGVFDAPTVGDFIGIATIKQCQEFSRRLDREMRAAAPGLKTVVADFMPIAPQDFLRSDHAPFMLAGMPAVMLTDTSNYRNPNYHKPTDTIETIDAARFTLVVRGIAGAAYAIAEPAGPQDKPGAGPRAK